MSDNSLDSLDCSVNSPSVTLNAQSDSDEGELRLEIAADNDQEKASESSEGYRCRWTGCGILFQRLEDMANHVTQTHASSGTGGLFFCGWEGCSRGGRGFNARYKMLVHVRTHTNEKPHRCFSCSKSFSRAENLKIHARTHTGERPYVCPVEGCGKAYSNSSDRFKHTRTHSVDKPYVCRVPGCPKRYTDPSSLRKHIKTFRHFVTNPETEEPSTQNSNGNAILVTSRQLGSGALVVTSESDQKTFKEELDSKKLAGDDVLKRNGDHILRSKLSCPPEGIESKEWNELLESSGFLNFGECIKRPLCDKNDTQVRSVRVCKEQQDPDEMLVHSVKEEQSPDNSETSALKNGAQHSRRQKSKGQSNSSANSSTVPLSASSFDGLVSPNQFNGYTPQISIDSILAQFGAAHMFGLGGIVPSYAYPPSLFGGWFSAVQSNGYSSWTGLNTYHRVPSVFQGSNIIEAHSDCTKQQPFHVPFVISQSEQLVPLDLSTNTNGESSLV